MEKEKLKKHEYLKNLFEEMKLIQKQDLKFAKEHKQYLFNFFKYQVLLKAIYNVLWLEERKFVISPAASPAASLKFYVKEGDLLKILLKNFSQAKNEEERLAFFETKINLENGEITPVNFLKNKIKYFLKTYKPYQESILKIIKNNIEAFIYKYDIENSNVLNSIVEMENLLNFYYDSALDFLEKDIHLGDCNALPTSCSYCLTEELFGFNSDIWKDKEEGHYIFENFVKKSLL